MLADLLYIKAEVEELIKRESIINLSQPPFV
jgi:hypothetical protein